MMNSVKQFWTKTNTWPARPLLGVAYAEVNGETSASENRLVWLGLVGMSDPVRAGAPDLICQLHAADIETVMITGDQSTSAGNST